MSGKGFLARVRAQLRRLHCALSGHEWTTWQHYQVRRGTWPGGEICDETGYSRHCTRCDLPEVRVSSLVIVQRSRLA